MESKIYNIVLSGENCTKTGAISSYSLHKIIDDFVRKDYKELHLIIDEECFKKRKKDKTENRLKDAFYYSKYHIFYNQFKSKKISESTFRKILTDLKNIKKNSKTFSEFEHKFEEYKNTL